MSKKKVVKAILVAISVLLTAAEGIDISGERESDKLKTENN